ncbi:allantoinase, partial [Tremellales sp. Uapishka_1]
MTQTDLSDFTLEREFIGYGYHTPDPKWPNQAKIAINFIIQYNVGSELSIDEGDDTFELYLAELQMMGAGEKVRMDMAESQYEYGPRVGVPRLIEMFKRHDLPVTWNMYTLALEKSPYWCKAIVDSGAEITLGGKRWIDYMNVEPEEEDKMIRESIDQLHTLTGDKTLPSGWFTDRRSNASIKLYAQAMADKGLPLLYSSDSCSDDLPFWTSSPVKGQENGLLMMPFSYDVSDLKFNLKGKGPSSPKDYFEHLMDTFECLYEEGIEGEPKMMTVILHPHIIGRAARMWYLERFLEHIKTVPGVWVARRDDIAKHFASVHPYDAKKAFGQTPVIPDVKFVPNAK